MKDVSRPAHDIKHSKTSLGFWVYLMTDCILFASLFVTFMVLRNNTAGGVAGKDIIDLNFVFVETTVLLISSVASGMALLEAYRGGRGSKRRVLGWLVVTGLLGAIFLGMEVYEFSHLLHEGHSWRVSGFLSAFFGLVGTHGLHITAGLVWLGVLARYIYSRGLSHRSLQNITMFSLFWHFLDIVWICIFTIVYLLGVL